MSMSVDITPEKYLEDLTPLLGQTGCIKSSHDVDKIISRMEDPNLLLVPKCILADVIKATKAPSTLDKFMTCGGWAILNTWMENSMKKGEENYPFIICLLDVLRKLPVTVDRLKQGNLGKLVNKLKKVEHEETSAAAGDLINDWMQLVKKTSNPSKSTKDATDRQRQKLEEEKKKAASLGPISASIRAKEKEATKPVTKRARKTKKKDEDGKGDEPAEKKAKPSDLTKLGGPTAPPTESAGFMNALSSATVPKRQQARKKSVPPLGKIPKTGAASVKREDATGEDSPRDGAALGIGGSATESAIASANTSANASQDLDDAASNSSEAMDTGGGGVRHQPVAGTYSGGGVLVSPGQRNRKKKRVTWAAAEAMREVYYFEIEEGERVNMHAKNFMDIAKMEKEKEALALRAYRSEAVETIPWRLVPITVDGASLVDPGFKSVEKTKQERREQSTLAFLFLSKASLPDTPGEPEPELSDGSRALVAEPKLIPIHDESDASGAGPAVVPPSVPAAATPQATVQSAPGLDSTQTQATVQNLLDKLKTKGVFSAEGAPPPAAVGVGPLQAVAMQAHFGVPGQPVPNRPPGPGMLPPNQQPPPGPQGLQAMGPMYDGSMPPPPLHPGMMPPPPHGMPPPPDAVFPPQAHGMRPPFIPQDGPPPPMGRGAGGGGGNWRPMGPGPGPGPGPAVGGPALLPTPPGPQPVPQPMQPGFQDDFGDGGGGGGGRQDYHGGAGPEDFHDDYDRPRGRGAFRGRRGGGRGRGVPCRHYMSPRGCTMGDKCRFFHPAPGSMDPWEGGGGGGSGGGFYDRPHRGGPFRGGGQFGPPPHHHEPHGEPGPGQFPHGEPGPGQFSHGEPGPGQFPHGEPGPGQFSHGEPGPGQFPHGEPGPGQFPHGPMPRDQPLPQHQPGPNGPMSTPTSASFANNQPAMAESREPQPVAAGSGPMPAAPAGTAPADDAHGSEAPRRAHTHLSAAASFADADAAGSGSPDNAPSPVAAAAAHSDVAHDAAAAVAPSTSHVAQADDLQHTGAGSSSAPSHGMHDNESNTLSGSTNGAPVVTMPDTGVTHSGHGLSDPPPPAEAAPAQFAENLGSAVESSAQDAKPTGDAELSASES